MTIYDDNINVIIEYIKGADLTGLPPSACNILLSESVDELRYRMFNDVRTNKSSLRLTDFGLQLLEPFFEHWKFETFKYSFSFIKILSENSNRPWHINSKRCILFDSDMAFNWMMANDFELFLGMYEKTG